jgi:hypothetical protein
VTQVVESELFSVLDWHSGFFGSRSQVVGDKTGSVERLPALLSD